MCKSKGAVNTLDNSSEESYVYSLSKSRDITKFNRSKDINCRYNNTINTCVNIKIKGVNIKAKIDTCSDVNIIDEITFIKLRNYTKLEKGKIKLYGYNSKTPIKLLGKFTETVQTKKKLTVAKFDVIKGNSGSLINTETAAALELINFTIKLMLKIR